VWTDEEVKGLLECYELRLPIFEYEEPNLAEEAYGNMVEEMKCCGFTNVSFYLIKFWNRNQSYSNIFSSSYKSL